MTEGSRIALAVLLCIAAPGVSGGWASGDEVLWFAAEAQERSGRDVGLTSRLVSVLVTVTDPYGRLVTGLRKEHFEVYDEKVKQEIAHFSDADAPVSIGIVYDLSGSMKRRVRRSIGALRRFLETSHKDDDFFLITFDDRPSLVQDFTSSPSRLISSLMFVEPKRSTALYDASYLAVEKLKEGRHAKKALLIISDGQDNQSRYTYREVRDRVREAGVLIYGIGIINPWTDSLAAYGRSRLEELSRITGGRAFFPRASNDSELFEICSRIALELRRQYSIGFYPTDVSGKSRWRKIKIKVKTPKGLGYLSLSYRDRYRSFGESRS